MIPRKIIIIISVIIMFILFILMQVSVTAQAACGNITNLPLGASTSSTSGSGGGAACYQLTGFSSSTTTLSVRIYVSSGSVNVYGADGNVQVLSRKLNARLVTQRANYAVPVGNSYSYTVAVVPVSQSVFTIAVTGNQAVVGTNSASESQCSGRSNNRPCAPAEATQPATNALPSSDPLLDADASSSVLFPFEASCRARLEIDLIWNGSAPSLQVILENASSNLYSFEGGSPLSVVYDLQPDDLASGSDWQWEVINSYGGSVVDLQTKLSYPDANTCSQDPYVLYGSEACIYGYVWREAFSGDTVCVTGDVRAQAADDNSHASERIDPNGAYGPNTCVYGYVWREASPSDLVCVIPDIRSQTAYDNSQRDRRRDTPDTPTVIVEPSTTTCPGLPQSRMVAGQYGIVLPGKPNNLRADPTTSGTLIGRMNANDEFLVVGGPVCADGYAWWQVNYGGQVGWTAESGNGNYWIGPI